METIVPPPWALIAWPPVLCQANSQLRTRLVHVDTRIASVSDADSPVSGQTIWCTDVCSHDAGVAWDWVQVMPDVVAMADPMAVITNMRFVGANGEKLSADESAVLLNELVFSLPWQREVVRTLRRRAAASPSRLAA